MEIAQATNAGTLDPSFGREGVLPFPVPEISSQHPEAILALPNGKLLVFTRLAGTVNAPLILRLNEDGTLDTGYGDSGTGYVELPGDIYSVFIGMNRSKDGGAVIGARFTDGSRSGTIVIRLREDGSFNDTFGEGGIVRINIWGHLEKERGRLHEAGISDLDKIRGNWRYSVVEDLNGRFVLVDQLYIGSGIKALAVRLHVDGSIDYSFGEFGGAEVDLPGIDYTWAAAGGVAVQADGKVLVCGRYGDAIDLGFYVVRFDEVGKLDPEFNNNRPVTISSVISKSLSISISKSDEGIERIVVAGEVVHDNELKGVIVVLNSNGSFNLVFNNGKPLFANLMYQNLGWWKSESLANGSIVVTGRAMDNSSIVVALLTARYLSDGSLDTQFNDGKGFAEYDVPGKSDVPTDMVVMEDGRIAISGFSTYEGWILRYLG